MSSCSHWHREIGKTSSLQYHADANTFKLIRFGDTWEEQELVGKFPMPHSSMIHMFSITEHFAVIALYPVGLDLLDMLTSNMHPFSAIKKFDKPTRFYLINLESGRVLSGFKTFDPRVVFASHHVNAWEEEGEVVVDMACNPWDSMETYFNMETMTGQEATGREAAEGVVRRVRLGLRDRAVNVEEWPNARDIPMLNTIDFPVINYDYRGRKNRSVSAFFAF